MELTCTSCKSDNIQRLSVVYEGGLSDVNTKTKGTAIGFSRGGAGIGFGRSKTKGTSQTAASKRAAPPQKIPYVWPLFIIAILFMILGGTIGSLLGNGPHKIIEGIVAFCWLVASAAWVYFAFQYNANTWPPLKANWDKSYLCNRCNAIFRLEM